LHIICKQGGPSNKSSGPPVNISFTFLFDTSFNDSFVCKLSFTTFIKSSNSSSVPFGNNALRSVFLKYGKLINDPEVLTLSWFIPNCVCLGNISVLDDSPNKNNLIKVAGTFSFVNT